MAEAEPGGLMACSPEILTELIEAAKTDETIALKLEHAGLVRDPSGAIFVPTPSGPGAHDDREWAATLAQGRAAVGPDPEDEDFEQPKGILSAHLRDEPKTFTGGAMQPAVIFNKPDKWPWDVPPNAEEWRTEQCRMFARSLGRTKSHRDLRSLETDHRDLRGMRGALGGVSGAHGNGLH